LLLPLFNFLKQKIMDKYIELIALYCNKAYQRLCAIPQDKLLHITVSAFITAVLNLFMPFLAVLLIMTLIFVCKEGLDYITKKGTAEWQDILADYVGFIIGII